MQPNLRIGTVTSLVLLLSSALVHAQEDGADPELDRHPAALNIVFGLDPGKGNYDGVVGDADDSWNLLDVGQTRLDSLVSYSGNPTPVRLTVSENDGEWGIPGHDGVFHAYIYHNNQSVDLQATLAGLSPGQYRIYVYAHGDSPNQNAEVELKVGDELVGTKTTLNDGTWDYREKQFVEGVQYVSFDFVVIDDSPVRVTSKRDGSGYSMFNALQVVRLMR